MCCCVGLFSTTTKDDVDNEHADDDERNNDDDDESKRDQRYDDDDRHRCRRRCRRAARRVWHRFRLHAATQKRCKQHHRQRRRRDADTYAAASWRRRTGRHTDRHCKNAISSTFVLLLVEPVFQILFFVEQEQAGASDYASDYADINSTSKANSQYPLQAGAEDNSAESSGPPE